jgi:hypothetical protein
VGQPKVDEYVARLPLHQRGIVEALRTLVRMAAPDAVETFKWAEPVYEVNGPFAYIKAHRDHVTFGFWRGVEIDAGRGLLESSGEKMAHVRLRASADIDASKFSRMVKEAVELNRRKGDPSRTR